MGGNGHKASRQNYKAVDGKENAFFFCNTALS
jgi:hypothetical protein